MKALTLSMFLLVLFLSASVFAEAYISDEVPSASIIANFAETSVDNVLGFYKKSDSEYYVYILVDRRVFGGKLIKLDSKKWLFQELKDHVQLLKQ